MFGYAMFWIVLSGSYEIVFHSGRTSSQRDQAYQRYGDRFHRGIQDEEYVAD